MLAGFGMVDSHNRRLTCVVYNGCSTPSCTLLFCWLISMLVSPHFPLRASPRCFVRTHCAPCVSATGGSLGIGLDFQRLSNKVSLQWLEDACLANLLCS